MGGGTRHAHSHGSAIPEGSVKGVEGVEEVAGRGEAEEVPPEKPVLCLPPR